MSDTPHLLVPYAALHSPAGQQALAGLALPQLDRLLARLTPLASDLDDEENPATPHERALARASGLPDAGGLIPWAAWHVRGLGAAAPAAPQDAAWAFVTPCHWQVRTDHVTLEDPADLGLDEAASRALLDVVAPWFAEDGIALHYDQPTRWLAHGAVFAGLASASLERVLHRDVRAWLPASAQAAGLRRLHSEMQMLLYTHAFNAAREARSLPPVNAFWVHGTGGLPAGAPAAPAAAPTLELSLRGPALREDWDAWAGAWQQLDAGPIAQLGAYVARGGAAQLTLCGERGALSWHSAPRSLRQKVSSIFSPQRFASVREQL
ncbi:phosphoglycerate mutase [Rhodococcus sp. SRB_17]|nr:phosphoglycerate mutase [Rhodococcus sp. SRB_17]